MKYLIFVYNAKSSQINKAIDFIHKAISPNTYDCNLCKLTHGILTERSKWKSFRKAEKIDMRFTYKDKFEKEFNLKLDYPVIIESPTMKIVFGKDEIIEMSSVEELIVAIKNI